MKKGYAFVCYVLVAVFSLVSYSAQAVTVTDSHGVFSIDYQPKRIVTLEFSFVDALASVGVSPVGIADDNDPSRLLSDVRKELKEWQSVGTRSQPSLEVIASLKPDLIIADVDRHSGVYNELNKIAPTLLLPSRRETYESNLKSAAIIGKVVGKEQAMKARLAQHQEVMNSIKHTLSDAGLAGKVVQFGVARENGFYAHARESYAGGVIRALGMQGSDKLKNENASRQISLEQLLGINPDYLIIGDYVQNSIVTQWAKTPLWRVLKSVKAKHVYHVDGNVWARCRGIMAAEVMARDLVQIIKAEK